MKRRNAILLGSAFLLMLAGYVGWCWQNFFLRPSFEYEKGLPQEGVKAIDQWRMESPSWEPAPISFRTAFDALSQPWDIRRRINVYQLEPGLLVVTEMHAVRPSGFFRVRDGHWEKADRPFANHASPSGLPLK